MKRALVGLAAVVALAATVIAWVLLGVEREHTADFERDLERVEWGTLAESELVTTWSHGFDSLSLFPGGSCRLEFPVPDTDVVLFEERRGTWERTEDGLTVRCDRAPGRLRSGLLDGRAVLVSDKRIWRRQAE